MNVAKFLFVLLVSRITHAACGNARSFITTKLEHSPFGVGVKSALSGRRQFPGRINQRTRHVQSDTIHQCSSAPELNTARHAAVQQSDAKCLGKTLAPHLRERKKTRVNAEMEELDWLQDESVVCSTKVAIAKTPSRTSLMVSAHQKSTIAVPTYQALAAPSSDPRGGGVIQLRPLFFWENMVCGAVSRSIAQTVMHPANTMKTILQSTRGVDRPTLGQLMQPDQFRMLTRGAGANFLLSVPHGAVNFAVLEFVRGRMNRAIERVEFLRKRLDSFGPALDFTSSAISTICCSVVSTPQMMITDNIMAGNYPNLPSAIKGLYSNGGAIEFYRGWWPGLVGKIPSYALTWTFFQQMKRFRDTISDRPATNVENAVMGCIASTTTVCIMIPMDTIKTRLVTQMSAKVVTDTAYKGIIDCAIRIAKEEGIRTFYRGLPPRLMSVVPMIGIQFGVYEAMKNVMLQRTISQEVGLNGIDQYGSEEVLEEAAMEVAASSAHPFPAPHLHKKIAKKNGRFGSKISA